MRYWPRALVILTLVLLCTTATVWAEDVHPTLDYLGFDAGTFTYTYQVSTPADMTYDFGQLIVLANVPDESIYAPWQLAAEKAPTTDWFMYSLERELGKYNAYWVADSGQSVLPGTVWTGKFFLTVPNSQETPGTAVTMDGGPGSSHPTTVYVPGPALIPEPSSVLSLGALAVGLISLIRRKR